MNRLLLYLILLNVIDGSTMLGHICRVAILITLSSDMTLRLIRPILKWLKKRGDL